MNFKEAQRCFKNNELSRAMEILNEYIPENTSDYQAVLLRARIHYRMQNWGDAINDYALVLDIEPDNPEAKSGMEMARNILGYFTPDMFNP